MEKQTWIVCGRNIGTASGWDQSDTFDMMLYDWEPAEPLREQFGPGPCTASFHFEHGTIEGGYTDAGIPAFKADLLDTLIKCERADAPR